MAKCNILTQLLPRRIFFQISFYFTAIFFFTLGVIFAHTFSPRCQRKIGDETGFELQRRHRQLRPSSLSNAVVGNSTTFGPILTTTKKRRTQTPTTVVSTTITSKMRRPGLSDDSDAIRLAQNELKGEPGIVIPGMEPRPGFPFGRVTEPDSDQFQIAEKDEEGNETSTNNNGTSSGGRMWSKNERGEPGSDSYYVIAPQLNSIIRLNKTAYLSRTCSAIKGRRILMNYAQNCCAHSQPHNCETGLKNGFDICIQFTQDSIDKWFLEQYRDIFGGPRIAGYGIWKSYLIMRVLLTLDDDDVLFYSDSGAHWLGSPEDYFCLMDERKQDAVVFSVGLPENEYTKGDAFLITGCLDENCTMSQQRLSGYVMVRRSMVAFNFLANWLSFNQDLRIVSDGPSTLKTDLQGFKANRHDQTALSLSSKRCGLPEWPDPSQWGADGYNKMLREKKEFAKIAKTIINCTRDKSRR